MKNNSLSTKGLSLSQAQSISNLCNQACKDINSKLSNINNATKTLEINDKFYIETQGHPIPDNIDELLKQKSELHAVQAFLMENITAKSELIDSLHKKVFVYDVPQPKYPEFIQDEYKGSSLVDEDWGWSQLTTSEYNEYLEVESFASHYGQFIHKGGKLDKLRNELPTIKTLEWIEIDNDKKTPLNVTIHHTIEQLGEVHEKLASKHRLYEQKVNYYKAKVKNLVTNENARIIKELSDRQTLINESNSKLNNEYFSMKNEWDSNFKSARISFEEKRQKDILEASTLRIMVDNRFKHIIDNYLNKLSTEEE